MGSKKIQILKLTVSSLSMYAKSKLKVENFKEKNPNFRL